MAMARWGEFLSMVVLCNLKELCRLATMARSCLETPRLGWIGKVGPTGWYRCNAILSLYCVITLPRASVGQASAGIIPVLHENPHIGPGWP